MRKRFLWSLLFSAVFMFILAPVNHYLTTDIHTLEQASDRNFVSLLIVESILVFGVAFQVISQYFSKHPDYKSVVFTHRRNNPNIPGEYYKVADVTIKSQGIDDKTVDEAVKAADEANAKDEVADQ